MNNSYLLNYLQQSGAQFPSQTRWFGDKRNRAHNMVPVAFLDCWKLKHATISFLKGGSKVIRSFLVAVFLTFMFKIDPNHRDAPRIILLVLRNDALIQQLFDGLKNKDSSNIQPLRVPLWESEIVTDAPQRIQLQCICADHDWKNMFTVSFYQ